MAQSIDGIVLERILESGARFREPQLLGVADGMLTGLTQMHSTGAVHGRLGPAGVLLTAEGGVWIFGAESSQAYAAPELLMGQPPGPASDVYGAAAVIAHLVRGAAKLPPTAADLDPAFGWLLGPALSVDPAARPTAGAALEALRALAASRHGPDWRRLAVLGGLTTGVAATSVVVLAGSSAAATGAAAAAGGVAATGIAATGVSGTAAGGVAAGGAAGAGLAGGGVAAGGAAGGSAAGGAIGGGFGAAASAGGVGSGVAGVGAGAGAGAGAGGGGLSMGLVAAVGAAVGVGVVGVTAAVVVLTGGGSTEQHDLPATADIYLAGTSDDDVSISDAGTRPLRIDLDGAGTVRFPSVSGELGACGGCEPESVDGGNKTFPSTNLMPLNGITGVVHEDRTLFVVGVFLGDGEPDQDDQVDLSDADSEETQEPGIGEVFFIGDGRTGDGDEQEIVVPDGAETLYLGFADGYSFQGVPGAYGDNSGSADIEVTLD
ncbi:MULTISPECIES: hypothetical protein [unclassified Nocardioides]|uniref:hypothetical protein n=1 Tax=unclassified Nocardioides TaxID=2615069 RepID=UPI0006FAF89E|nr:MULTISPECIES: hypothetical protein [unclassified Nocardioides]KRA38048.1 hypothetical protein ASD81_05075 [Nocardioides sp. Root614]KRA92008.1 hypothetical protein ASD84_05340 [Nocardioides sp. Root682]